MKRIIAPAFLFLTLSFLLAKEGNFAEETSLPDLAKLQWHLLQPNATKTDLGGNLPEVAIVTLSNDQFQLINGKESAAMKYFEEQKIFKRNLYHVKFCDVTASRDGTGPWILTVSHTYLSTAYVVAWQVPSTGGK